MSTSRVSRTPVSFASTLSLDAESAKLRATGWQGDSDYSSEAKDAIRPVAPRDDTIYNALSNPSPEILDERKTTMAIHFVDRREKLVTIPTKQCGYKNPNTYRDSQRKYVEMFNAMIMSYSLLSGEQVKDVEINFDIIAPGPNSDDTTPLSVNQNFCTPEELAAISPISRARSMSAVKINLLSPKVQ